VLLRTIEKEDFGREVFGALALDRVVAPEYEEFVLKVVAGVPPQRPLRDLPRTARTWGGNQNQWLNLTTSTEDENGFFLWG
jgi:hypothetical protein